MVAVVEGLDTGEKVLIPEHVKDNPVAAAEETRHLMGTID